MKKFSLILLELTFTAMMSAVPVFVAVASEPENIPMMQVAPVIEELSLAPASETKKSITVTNQSDSELKIRVYVAPYSFSFENNVSDFESQTEYTQIYHWIKILDSESNYKDEVEFSIKPHKTSAIDYRVRVPESAPGGSQHACIFVETIPGGAAESSSITTVSRAAIKIFADISGETEKDALIEATNTNTFVIGGRVSARTVVKNIGNVDIKPTLTLKIDALNGETVFNKTGVEMIFPEDSGEIVVEWPETPVFGIYNLTVSTNILGKNSMINKTIFILPVWFMILLFVAVVVCVVFVRRHILLRRQRRRRRNTKH